MKKYAYFLRQLAIVPTLAFVLLLIAEFSAIGAFAEMLVSKNVGYWAKALLLLAILCLAVYVPRTFYVLIQAFWRILKYRPGAETVSSPSTSTNLVTAIVEGPEPLPTQRHIIDKIWRAVEPADTNRRRPGNIIPLRGDWGAGKSTILQAFQHEAEESLKWRGHNNQRRRPRVVTIYFEAFTNEAFPLLEFALFRTVAANWHLLWPFGWLAVPVIRMFLTSTPLTLKLALKQADSTANMETKLNGTTPPQVLWYTHYCRLISIALRRVDRVVVIVDEIDRCSPDAAQKYITLVRRFLVIPGVSVIIPYVREQIRYKAFDPLKTELPDLAGSSQAVLWEFFGKAVLRDITKPPQKPAPTPVPVTIPASGTGGPQDDRCCVNVVLPETSSEKPRDDSSLSDKIKKGLMSAYLSAPEHTRQAVMRKLEEKYLFDDLVTIGDMSVEDFVIIVCQNQNLRALISDFRQVPFKDKRFGSSGNRFDLEIPGTTQTMAEACEQLWMKLTPIKADADTGYHSRRRISVRALNGSLCLLFSSLPLPNVGAAPSGSQLVGQGDGREAIATRLAIILILISIALEMIAAENRQLRAQSEEA